MFYYIDPMYFAFMLPGLLLSLWATAKVKMAFSKYRRKPNSRGVSGAQVAQEMLSRAGVHDVRIEQTGGWLSDHYSPREKVVRLSPEVFQEPSIAAAGIAAHEVGHAIQHNKSYGPLALRSYLAPAATAGQYIAFGALILGGILEMAGLLWIGLIAFSILLLFQLITLPVEFNASRRAKTLLVEYGIVGQGEVKQVNKVLTAAAMTYVAAFVTVLLQFLYFFLRIVAASRD
jgi:Zn-dependent membrane protease YugP